MCMAVKALPKFARPWRKDEDSEDELLVTRNDASDANCLQGMYACYTEAIAIKERLGIPVVGASIDRRTYEHLVQRYNDAKICSRICFLCARVHTDSGSKQSDIRLWEAEWFFQQWPVRTLKHALMYKCYRRKF